MKKYFTLKNLLVVGGLFTIVIYFLLTGGILVQAAGDWPWFYRLGGTNSVTLPSGIGADISSSTLGHATTTGDLAIEGLATTSDNLEVGGQMVSGMHDNTYAATTTIDWNNGNSQEVTLTGDTYIQMTNGINGGRYLLKIKQDGTGSRLVTWASTTADGEVKFKEDATTTLTTTANRSDFIGFLYTDSLYFAIASSTNFKD